MFNLNSIVMYLMLIIANFVRHFENHIQFGNTQTQMLILHEIVDIHWNDPENGESLGFDSNHKLMHHLF